MTTDPTPTTAAGHTARLFHEAYERGEVRVAAYVRAEPRAEALRAALAVAKDIIDANPAEDQCRHGSYVYECDEPDGCADRSRREQIDAALAPEPEPS